MPESCELTFLFLEFVS